jgi:hypothetical protein
MDSTTLRWKVDQLVAQEHSGADSVLRSECPRPSGNPVTSGVAGVVSCMDSDGEVHAFVRGLAFAFGLSTIFWTGLAAALF